MTEREKLGWPLREYAELEISLHRRGVNSYIIDMRFSRSDSEVDIRLIPDGMALMRLNTHRLRMNELDPAAYGQSLSDSLFKDPSVRDAFAQARSSADALNMPLRLRLSVARSALELHAFRWETLRDPLDGSWLVTNERVLFSRYLSSNDWRPVRPRAKSELRALVVIANPVNISQYAPGGRQLEAIDVGEELERTRHSLSGIHRAELASRGAATLNNILASLRSGYNILYVIAHGALRAGEPWLLLEDADGSVDRVSGHELVARLRELDQRPRLVVLASCQSAGAGAGARSDDNGVQSALGPVLAEAGVPAVLAMQGNVSMRTASEFMSTFFKELQRDGQVDRAAAVARGVVRDRPDAWMPVLFMRLKTGRLWYERGFARELGGFTRWEALRNDIRNRRCTPVLGPGLIASLGGSPSEIAQHWSEKYSFPLAAHNRETLSQVAQYLAIRQERIFPHEQLADHLCSEILERHGHSIPPERYEDWHARLQIRDAPPQNRYAVLDELIEYVGTQLREHDPTEPHRVLAMLPFRTYITANPDSLLEIALKAAGKEPVVQVCRWNEQMNQGSPDGDPDYEPDVEHPLVYHLFGRLEEPESLVLTEHDYFNFLTGMTKNKDQIPSAVLADLVKTGLLFLGFQVEDWDFRVLLHSILDLPGIAKGERYTRVAAQIDPAEDRVLAPGSAHRYLMDYFQLGRISIYWGSVKDFTSELLMLWNEGNSAAPDTQGGS